MYDFYSENLVWFVVLNQSSQLCHGLRTVYVLHAISHSCDDVTIFTTTVIGGERCTEMHDGRHVSCCNKDGVLLLQW